MVVPGTPRDSLHILDTLLNLDGGVKPEMVATDNASYSDMVFGLFKILGYNFSPRSADLDDQRFWRAEMDGIETGGYGPLEALARTNKVNLKKVTTQWPPPEVRGRGGQHGVPGRPGEVHPGAGVFSATESRTARHPRARRVRPAPGRRLHPSARRRASDRGFLAGRVSPCPESAAVTSPLHLVGRDLHVSVGS